jgi:hypothetical protein
MLTEFRAQNYLIVEQNVVTNIVVWNGDTTVWTPPSGSISLIQAVTPAMIWEPVIVNNQITDYVLTEVVGSGSIGFTWDGSVLTTNQPKPAVPVQG